MIVVRATLATASSGVWHLIPAAFGQLDRRCQRSLTVDSDREEQLHRSHDGGAVGSV